MLEGNYPPPTAYGSADTPHPINGTRPLPQPPRKYLYASRLGAIRLRKDKKTGALTYVQRGGNQTAVDRNGDSLDTYIHAIFGLVNQRDWQNILMIGCGGGTLGRMIARANRKLTIVDIDKASFKLARSHFRLPPEIDCKVGDGLAFMQKTRRRFDAVIVDAFIGETIPAQFTGDAFCRAARRCLRPTGALLMNVCLNDKRDLTADGIALRLQSHGWSVRVLDQRGTARNAIVLAGAVKGIRKPRFLAPPEIERARIRCELAGTHFRKLKRAA